MSAVTIPGSTATYTAWQLTLLPGVMPEQAPLRASYAVTREPGGSILIGWIPLTLPRVAIVAGALTGEFLRVMAAAGPRAARGGAPALVIQPGGDLPVPRASGCAVRLEDLGRRLVTPVRLTGQMIVWPGPGSAGGRRVSLLPSAAARRFGFAWQLRHGPALLCAADGTGAGIDVTASQLVWQLNLPSGHRCPPARAGQGQVAGGV